MIAVFKHRRKKSGRALICPDFKAMDFDLGGIPEGYDSNLVKKPDDFSLRPFSFRKI